MVRQISSNGSVLGVLYYRNSFGGRDSRPPPPSRRDRSSSAERSSVREGPASGPGAPPSLLDLPKIPPPAIQEGGSDNRKSHGTDGHQGPPGQRFQGPRGPPGPGKDDDLIFMSLTHESVVMFTVSYLFHMSVGVN